MYFCIDIFLEIRKKRIFTNLKIFLAKYWMVFDIAKEWVLHTKWKRQKIKRFATEKNRKSKKSKRHKTLILNIFLLFQHFKPHLHCRDRRGTILADRKRPPRKPDNLFEKKNCYNSLKKTLKDKILHLNCSYLLHQ